MLMENPWVVQVLVAPYQRGQEAGQSRVENMVTDLAREPRQ